MQYPLLRDLAIIFAGSLLVILVFHRLKLPALPGFIVAGVLLGPNALGLVSDVHQVESLAEVGVILLLFTIGIEFSLSRLREMGRQVVIGGGAQVLLTVGLSAALAVGVGLACPSPCSWDFSSRCPALPSCSRDSPTKARSTRRTVAWRRGC